MPTKLHGSRYKREDRPVPLLAVAGRTPLRFASPSRRPVGPRPPPASRTLRSWPCSPPPSAPAFAGPPAFCGARPAFSFGPGFPEGAGRLAWRDGPRALSSARARARPPRSARSKAPRRPRAAGQPPSSRDDRLRQQATLVSEPNRPRGTPRPASSARVCARPPSSHHRRPRRAASAGRTASRRSFAGRPRSSASPPRPHSAADPVFAQPLQVGGGLMRTSASFAQVRNWPERRRSLPACLDGQGAATLGL